jgi:hypothetical protein
MRKNTWGGQNAWWEAKTRGEKPKRAVGGAGDSTRVPRRRGGFENVLGVQISVGEIQTGGGRSQRAVGGSNAWWGSEREVGDGGRSQ